MKKFQKTRKDLEEIDIPLSTNSYKAISHKTLIDLTLESADKTGLKLIKESYDSIYNGEIATGYYDFNFGGDPSMGLRIAWQNSYNKKISLKFAIGAQVFVCENGCFYGTIGGFKKKHTGEVETFTPNKIQQYFSSAQDIYSLILNHKDQMKNISITKKTIAEIVGDLYISEDLLKETQIAIIKKEIENPSFNYGAPDTVWEMYNHVTHSLKTIHVSDYIDSHLKTHNYFVDKFNLKLI